MTDLYKIDKINNDLYLIGDINTQSVNEIHQHINKIEKDNNVTSINFYITSDGGYTREGLKLYDIFQATRLNITIYVSSCVGSAATYILFGKHKVVMYQSAMLFFHELFHQVQSGLNNAKVAIELSDRLTNKVIDIYSSKIPEITKEWLITDRYIDTNQALTMKIVDEVK